MSTCTDRVTGHSTHKHTHHIRNEMERKIVYGTKCNEGRNYQVYSMSLDVDTNTNERAKVENGLKFSLSNSECNLPDEFTRARHNQHNSQHNTSTSSIRIRTVCMRIKSILYFEFCILVLLVQEPRARLSRPDMYTSTQWMDIQERTKEFDATERDDDDDDVVEFHLFKNCNQITQFR